MTWKAGHSGNPSGRYKLTEGQRETLRRAMGTAIECTPAVIRRLASLAIDHPDPKVCVQAAKLILERSMGPAQPVEVDERDKAAALSDEQLRAIAARILGVPEPIAIQAQVDSEKRESVQ